ncbi:MAG: DsbA family protein [Halocynthiibacter sp.]
MAPVQISYFSDVLCVWAWAGERRLEQLVGNFGDEIAVETHFCQVFPDAWGKIDQNWQSRGGFEGFNRHINDVAKKFDHIDVHERLWLETRPRSSDSAHLFLKAVELVEREQNPGKAGPQPYLDRVSIRAAHDIRRAFFVSARDISDWRVYRDIAENLGLDYAGIEEKIFTSEAAAHLAADYILAQKHKVEGSPTFIMNNGRQKLFGNVGYRLIEANVQELLRRVAQDEASWC